MLRLSLPLPVDPTDTSRARKHTGDQVFGSHSCSERPLAVGCMDALIEVLVSSPERRDSNGHQLSYVSCAMSAFKPPRLLSVRIEKKNFFGKSL